MILKHTIKKEEQGRSLLYILRGPMGLSAGMVRALKFYGGLFVDETLQFTNYKVTEGQVVTAHITHAQGVGDNIPEQGPLEVLWEDQGMLVVNKPPGMLVHPSRAKNSGTLANYAAGYLEKANERPVCHVVNRLDRDTSGVVVFAKNPYMKDGCSRALQMGEKRYKALAYGSLSPKAGEINLPIKRKEEGNMYRIIHPDGKEAKTRYETEKVENYQGVSCSLLDIVLLTGRTHQIRVHTLAVGSPLMGDCLYYTQASKTASEHLGFHYQLLHCHQLSFIHPHTKEALCIKAPLPKDHLQWY